MTSYQIEITEPAENDLYDIINYIAKELREPLTAQQVAVKMGAAILDLELFPLRNALVTDDKLAAQGIRKLVIDNYLVFYVISENDKLVTVVRILYGRRDWIHVL